MSKAKKDGTVRKSTKGIPRVTDKVLGMDEAGRKAWLDKVPAQFRTEVEARLTEALKVGRKVKSVDFSTVFNGRTVEELTVAKSALDAALAIAAVSAEAEAEAKIAELTASLAAMKQARASVAARVPAVA